MNPVVHSHTEIVLRSLEQDLPQSILLSGDTGVGLGTIAKFIATSQHVIPYIVLPEKNEKIDLEKGNISVEAIRELYGQTRTKRVGKQIIIIDYAERMSLQAQNAFLKLLEEPNDSTYFLLATHAPGRLLPTVLSRMRHVEVRHITKEQSEALLDTLQVNEPTKRTQILFMAAGLPAEMTRLVRDEDYFAARSTIMRDARDLLQADTYQKLLIANTYKDDRERALQLLADATKIIRRSLSAKPTPQLSHKLTVLITAYEKITANGNIRLCLAEIVVQ